MNSISLRRGLAMLSLILALLQAAFGLPLVVLSVAVMLLALGPALTD